MHPEETISAAEQLKLLFATRSSASQHFWNVFRVFATLHSALVAFAALMAALLSGGKESRLFDALPASIVLAVGCAGTLLAFAWATSAARLLYHLRNKEELIRRLELSVVPEGRRMLTARPDTEDYFRPRRSFLRDGLSTKNWGRLTPWLFLVLWVGVAGHGILRLF